MAFLCNKVYSFTYECELIRKVVGLLDEIAGGYMLIWIAETRKCIILFIIVN